MFGQQTVSVIDTATNTVGATFGGETLSGKLSAAGERLYLLDSDLTTVRIIDTATNTAINQVDLPITAGGDFAVSTEGSVLYVSHFDSDNGVTGIESPLVGTSHRLLEPLRLQQPGLIDAATGALITSVPVPSGSTYPTVSPDGTQVSFTGTQSVVTIAPKDTTVVAGVAKITKADPATGIVTGTAAFTNTAGTPLTCAAHPRSAPTAAPSASTPPPGRSPTPPHSNSVRRR